MSRRRKTVSRVLAAVGALFLLAALISLYAPYRKAHKAAAKLPEIAQALIDLLPRTKTQDFPTSLPSMPIRVYEGTDYIALVEFPAFDVCLPVRAEYADGNAGLCPFLESGSAYDGDLLIGGIRARGQFDFFDRVDIGDAVWLTDMRGGKYLYEVITVRHSRKLDMESYRERGAEAVIYSYQPYAPGCLAVLCRRKPDGTRETEN